MSKLKASMIDDSIITGEVPKPSRRTQSTSGGWGNESFGSQQFSSGGTQQFSSGGSQYGSGNFSIHSQIRKAISDMFPNFYMTKTQQYNDPTYGSYGIYKARVGSFTIGPTKYLAAFVMNDSLPVGSQKMLSSLSWSNFQTRETDNPQKEFGGMQLSEQFTEMKENPVLMDRIHLAKEGKYSYIYKSANLPIKIELMPVNEDDHFAQEGTIVSALSLYTTSLTLE